MATREQIDSFHRFASEQLRAGGSEKSIDELYDEWRSKNLSPEELAENIAAVQAAVDDMWQYTAELFEGNDYEERWHAKVRETVDQATLKVPTDPYQRTGGRSGFHTEHLGFLLAEMQWLQRSHPGLTW